MATLYFTIQDLGTKEFYVEPENENGYDWDSEDRYEEIGYLQRDGGMVSIERLRKALDEFESKGANYVNIDYHCDHNEVEVTGVVYRTSTEKEIEDFIKAQEEKKEMQKADAIAKLKAEIDRIKNI
jgi:hypothetical protein